MACYVYILRSLKDGSYYYGSSTNLQQRLKEHNAGKSRFTRGHRPFVLHYQEEHPSRREALKRELFFKSIQGYYWLRYNNIIQDNFAMERWPSG